MGNNGWSKRVSAPWRIDEGHRQVEGEEKPDPAEGGEAHDNETDATHCENACGGRLTTPCSATSERGVMAARAKAVERAGGRAGLV